MIGKVIKGVGGVFTVATEQGQVRLFAPKKIRYNDIEVLVGDNVEYSLTDSCKGVINKVLPRRNKMLRPEVANIDVALILIAIEPKPDLLLIDKIIINCIVNDIKPVIVINKIDLCDNSYIENLADNYSPICDIVAVSATTNHGIEELRCYFDGSTVCLAGQSAVGKTSLLNSIIPEHNGKIGGLSAKINRGTNTTRHSEIYPIWNGFIVDTAGFSLLELTDISYGQLMLYYPEFDQFQNKCKYNMCSHTVEPQCAVIEHMNNGGRLLRYERYVELYNQLQKSQRQQYVN